MSERVRFLADENLRRSIVKGVRRLHRDIDFQTADEANTSGMDDAALLVFASSQGRLLVSHDVRTLPEHFAALLADGQHSAGVILMPWQVSHREAIEALSLVWQVSSAEEWIDVLDYLPWH